MKKNKKRFKYHEPFVMLGRDMILRCDEWKNLSCCAKLFYLYLKTKFNGQNNGGIHLCYSELKGIKGISSPATVSKAIKELEDQGWIKRTEIGGIYGFKNKYQLTGKHDRHIINQY